VSALSQFVFKQRTRWLQRRIDPAHHLRRRLAYYVAEHGFEIGDYSMGEPTIRFYDRCKLRVGKYSSIAVGSTFLMGGIHPTDAVTTSHLRVPPPWIGPVVADTVVGSDVWIATNTLILSGVTIGDGAVIGAGSIVIDDVPPYGVVFGNPARVMRKRFSEETIQALLALRWWDFPDAEVLARQFLLKGKDVVLAINAFRSLKGLPPWTPTAEAPPAAPADRDLSPQRSRTEDELCRWCIARLAGLLEIAPDKIDRTTRIARLGIDSTQMLTFVFDLEELSGLQLDPTILHEHPTIQALAAYLADQASTGAAPLTEMTHAVRNAV
jgi:acetyltransferase-like isoleucine patch superfamily enzyme/acyl carrier protein